MNKEGNNSWKIFLLISIVFITLIIIILISTGYAGGYEVSLYQQYPVYLWAFFTISIISGIITIFISNRRKHSIFGMGIIVYTNIILLSIPIIRGYYLYGGGDFHSHMGTFKDIIRTGEIGGRLIYPSTHLLTVNLHQITGFSLEKTTHFLPIFLYLFFILSFLILFRKFSFRKFKYGICFCSLLIYNMIYLLALSPHFICFLFLPLIIYLLINKSTPKINILLGILMFSIIFFHPITSLLIALVVLFLLIFKLKPIEYQKSKHGYYYLLFFSGIWFTWYFDFPRFQEGFKTSFYRIFLDSNGTDRVIAGYTRGLSMYDIKITDFIQIFITRFGILMILFILSFIVIMQLVSKEKKDILIKDNLWDFRFSSFNFLFFSFLQVIIHSVPFLLAIRYYKYILFFSVMTITFGLGYITHKKIKNNEESRYVKNFTIVIISLLIIISVFTVFHSPVNYNQNNQITYTEYRGMEWTFENRPEDEHIWHQGINKWRVSHLIYGRENSSINARRASKAEVDDHFGYNETNQIGNRHSGLFVRTERTMMLYRERYEDYPEYWRFTENDLEKLEKDSSANRVYDSGTYFTVYRTENSTYND